MKSEYSANLAMQSQTRDDWRAVVYASGAFLPLNRVQKIMNSAEILSAQIARELTGQRKLVVRFQHPMPGPAFNHAKVGAEWFGFTLQDRRLRGSFGKPGRELSADEIESLFAMVPDDKIDFGDEADFFEQYAGRDQFNTDPQVICWPAQAILGGMNIAQQVDEFLRRFVE